MTPSTLDVQVQDQVVIGGQPVVLTLSASLHAPSLVPALRTTLLLDVAHRLKVVASEELVDFRQDLCIPSPRSTPAPNRPMPFTFSEFLGFLRDLDDEQRTRVWLALQLHQGHGFSTTGGEGLPVQAVSDRLTALYEGLLHEGGIQAVPTQSEEADAHPAQTTPASVSATSAPAVAEAVVEVTYTSPDLPPSIRIAGSLDAVLVLMTKALGTRPHDERMLTGSCK